MDPWEISTPFVDPPPTPNDVVISAAAGIPIVTALPVAEVSISLAVPPIVSVSESRSIAIVPESVVRSRSSAVICVST